MSQKTTMTTFDQVQLVADWSPVPTTLGVAVLLHMMPADRTSWIPFTQVLSAHRIASLALDLRGHGESLKTVDGGTLDYRKFSDVLHQQSLNDVITAVDWLVGKGYSKSQIFIVGASFGANLALWMLDQEPSLAGAVLLSPGDYHGISAVEEAVYVKSQHALWAAGSDADDPDAYEAAKAVIETAGSDYKLFQPYKNSGHGTHLFTSDPELMEQLSAWMEEALQQPVGEA